MTNLLDEVVNICDKEKYSNQSEAAKQDFLFMEQKNNDLRKIINILTDFGVRYRYYNMDIITGKTPSGDDPESQWQEFEFEILHRNPDGKNLVLNKLDEGYQIINKHITTLLARFCRALCRLFTLGPISNYGKSLSAGIIHPFLFLTDGELGKTDWL